MRYVTTVFLPALGGAPFAPALSAALAPYDLNDYAHEPFDPAAGWDSWTLPSSDALPLRRWRRRDPAVVRLAPVGIVAAAPKRLVDFDEMRAAAGREASGAWDAWAKVVRTHPPALPRTHFTEQSEFMLQPAIQEVAQAAVTQRHRYFTFSVLLADPVTHFGDDRAAFIARASTQAFTTHAYLTLDGQWLTQHTADRGWDTHVAAMTAYLDTLPDDTLITRVSCHA
ncbi:hypothetical protein GCM10009827_086210 [Dactylosporangium maewongense]|uniref:Uncharacterized protein n=1 Tax=Dactylosporangium maewongense TaxID=634393 RepID=A0ABP4MY30_9ACTN